MRADCYITISTKSSSILQDIDVLQKLRNVKVTLSLNTLDEVFRANMDNASSIEERIKALKTLYEAGIYTVCD